MLCQYIVILREVLTKYLYLWILAFKQILVGVNLLYWRRILI